MRKIIEKIKLWLELKKLKKEININIDDYFSSDSYRVGVYQQQKKLEEGILKLKRRVNELAFFNNSKEYDKVLKNIDNLIKLSKDESREQALLRKLKEKAVVHKARDVKSKKDKKNMISDRINDYYELQKHKKKRELLRKMRQAVKDGDEEMLKKLRKEYEEKYDRKKSKTVI